MNNLIKTFKNGIFNDIRLVGLCPALAVTATVKNGLGMGILTALVLILSNFVVTLIRKLISSKIHTAVYFVISALFVTVIEMLIKAYIPSLSESLGIFIPLIFVNCMVLGGADAQDSVRQSVLKTVGTGAGFTAVLLVLSIVREVLGNGTFFGMAVLPSGYQPVMMMALAPGAFITLGLMIGGVNLVKGRFVND